MSVPSHCAAVTGGTKHGPRSSAKAAGAPAQGQAGARCHDELLHAVGQLDVRWLERWRFPRLSRAL